MGTSRVNLNSNDWTSITTAGGSGETVLFEAKRIDCVYRYGTTKPEASDREGFTARLNTTTSIAIPANETLYARQHEDKRGWVFVDAVSITLALKDRAGAELVDRFGDPITVRSP